MVGQTCVPIPGCINTPGECSVAWCNGLPFKACYDGSPPTDPDDSTRTDNAALQNDLWYNDGDASFNLGTSTDIGSEVWYYEFYWGPNSNGAVSAQIAGTFAPPEIPDCSTYYLRLRARDWAGHYSNTRTSFILKFDRDAPVMTNGPGYTVSPNMNGWLRTDVDVSYTATDNCPQLEQRYKWNSNPWTAGTLSNTSVLFDGVHTFSARIADKVGIDAGHTGSHSILETYEVFIDRTPPDLTIDGITPDPDHNGWYNRGHLQGPNATNLSMTLVDSTSGIWDIYRRVGAKPDIDNATISDSGDPDWIFKNTDTIAPATENNNLLFNFDLRTLSGYSDGLHTVHFKFRDRAANENERNHLVKIDQVAPCDSASHNCSFLINSGDTTVTNSNVLSIFSLAQDGTGSQPAKMEIGYRQAGATQPVGNELHVPFSKSFNDPTNTNVMAYQSFHAGFVLNDPALNGGVEAWYVLCARYQDQAGNTSLLNHTGWSPDPAQFNELTGNQSWPVGLRFGHTKLCSSVNIDTKSPGAPVNIRLTQSQGGVPDSITLFGPDSTVYNFPDLVTLINIGFTAIDVAATPVWSNQSTVRVRYENPPNPAPASALKDMHFFLTGNYTPGSGGPGSNMSSADQGNIATVENDATGPFFQLTYDPNVQKDGCKNLYLWLSDEAGNKNNPDGSFTFATALFCFDGNQPEAPTNLDFYSYNQLLAAPGSINTTTKEFNPDIADQPVNRARLDYNHLSSPVTNKLDFSNNPDRILVVFNEAQDYSSGGHNPSGLDTVEPYQLCWAETAEAQPGDAGTTCRTTIEEYTNPVVPGEKKFIYVLTTAEMNALLSKKYYFFALSKDRAGNVSEKSNSSIVHIDTDEPCWQKNGSGDPIGSSLCTFQVSNEAGNVLLSTSTRSNLSMGLQGQLAATTTLPYLICGDNLGGEFCDKAYADTTAGTVNGQPVNIAGGLVARFAITSNDHSTGSGFDPNAGKLCPTCTDDLGNVLIGVGLDVWDATNQQEIVYWLDQPVQASSIVDGPKPLGDGNIPFNIHLFASKGGNNYTYYQANPPVYSVFDNSNAANNINRIEYTLADGHEGVHNIYLRLRDIAQNWSFHRPDLNKVHVQPIVVDTKPPPRLLTGGSIATIKQSGSEILRIRENSGVVEYSADTGGSYSSQAESLGVSKSDPAFEVELQLPPDFSNISGLWYKKQSVPTAFNDNDAQFIAVNSSTPSFMISANTNYQPVYIWLKDGSGNPDTAVVPGINDYYSIVNNAGRPCHSVANGIIDYQAYSDCRVLRIELPSDLTGPVHTTAIPPYLSIAGPAAEQTFVNTFTVNFKGAADSAAGVKESGLRQVQTYKLCYEPVSLPDNCQNFYYIDDPSGSATDLSYNIVTPLSDGKYNFYTLAFDQAGNQSAPSNSKEILVDTIGPCASASDICSIKGANGYTSIGTQTATLGLVATDAGIGVVTEMIVGEYYDDGSGNCSSIFRRTDGTMSSPQSQPCTGELDALMADGITPKVANTVLTYDISLDDFTVTAGSGVKKVQALFKDSAGKWGPVISEDIILDIIPPDKPVSLSTENQWHSANLIPVIIEFPTNDASSTGPPNFGIGGSFAKVGSLPITDSDGDKRTLNQMQQLGDGRYSVPVSVTTQGPSTVYLWLEDVNGHKSKDNYEQVTVFYDSVGPSKPGQPDLAVLTSSAQPHLSWSQSFDLSGSGMRLENTYKACWGSSTLNLAGCETAICGSAPVSGKHVCGIDSGAGFECDCVSDRVDFQLKNTQSLAAGNWHFQVYAFDLAGNQSQGSDTNSLLVVNQPRLQLLGTGEYETSTFTPRGGAEGLYTFKLLYFEPGNNPPVNANILLDINGNNLFEAGEVFAMAKNINGADQAANIDNNYVNGEEYFLQKELFYSTENQGKINYRYQFSSVGVDAIGSTGIPIDTNGTIDVNRYRADFDGIAQVRNNVQRPQSSQAVVIVLRPPSDLSTSISIQIYSRSGRHVRTLVRESTYSSLGRNYLYWNQQGENGQRVGSGLYYAIVSVGKESKSLPIAIVR